MGKSTFTRRNLRGGIGIHNVRTGTAIDRYSFGELNTDFYEKTILPTKADSLPGLDDNDCEYIRIWKGRLYGIFNNAGVVTLRSYSIPPTDAWSAAILTLDGKNTGYNTAHYDDHLVINYGEKMVLIDASGNATLQAHTAIDDAQDQSVATEISHIINWQGELYGINSDRLFVIYNGITKVWDNLSVAPLPANRHGERPRCSGRRKRGARSVCHHHRRDLCLGYYQCSVEPNPG